MNQYHHSPIVLNTEHFHVFVLRLKDSIGSSIPVGPVRQRNVLVPLNDHPDGFLRPFRTLLSCWELVFIVWWSWYACVSFESSCTIRRHVLARQRWTGYFAPLSIPISNVSYHCVLLRHRSNHEYRNEGPPGSSCLKRPTQMRMSPPSRYKYRRSWRWALPAKQNKSQLFVPKFEFRLRLKKIPGYSNAMGCLVRILSGLGLHASIHSRKKASATSFFLDCLRSRWHFLLSIKV